MTGVNSLQLISVAWSNALNLMVCAVMGETCIVDCGEFTLTVAPAWGDQ